MTTERNTDEARLLARLGDAIEKCNRGSVATLPFLTPRARKQTERALRAMGVREQSFFFGGYPDAERACLFLLPDYYAAMLGAPPCECAPETLLPILEDNICESVQAIRITGSGYRVLTHRDYLGSILGLGLERDALGDIAVQNDREAVVFCPRAIKEFLLENLTKVASDTVKCKAYEVDEDFTDGKKYRPISDTVASPRIDCVVAALTNLSREAAQNAIRTGLVEVDFEIEERTDATLIPPVTLSIRGYGRFILRSFDGETRKGRLRLRADQLI